MTLSEYLDANNMTGADFATRIGVSRQALHRYVNGERRPEWPVIERIAAATDGAVTANDFMSLPAGPPPPADVGAGEAGSASSPAAGEAA